MEDNRRVLSGAILRLLADGRPRTAREMAVELRSNARLAGIERRDVNSLLYRELADQLTKDGWFRWSLLRRSSDHGGPSRASVNKVSLPTASEHGSLLRTVHRLRAGLPPFDNLATLTVGGDHICPVLSRFLQKADGPRWMVISGNYGEGKSHSLALLRELAQQDGYATCQLNADGALAALNHPQRFLPTLLATLETPGRAARGYANLVFEALTDQESKDRIRQIVIKQIVRHLLRSEAERLVRILADSSDNTALEALAPAADEIALHLSGESIQHRSATEGTRIFAYSLLKVAIEILISSGLRGLVLLIDETESISTKLKGVRSRLGAYRVLAALCESPEFVNCKVSLAATPDALRQFTTEIPYMMSELGSTPGEPVQQWAKRLNDGPPILACRSLGPGQRGELLNSVRRIYSEAYQGSFRIAGAPLQTGDRSPLSDVPTRLLVRSAIDRLDADRWSPRMGR
jgi:hypothetical protein